MYIKQPVNLNTTEDTFWDTAGQFFQIFKSEFGLNCHENFHQTDNIQKKGCIHIDFLKAAGFIMGF